MKKNFFVYTWIIQFNFTVFENKKNSYFSKNESSPEAYYL